MTSPIFAGESWHKACRNCEDKAPFHPDAFKRIAVAA